MNLKELMMETKSKFGDDTNVSDYEKYTKWIEEAHEKVFDTIDEDEKAWRRFEQDLANATSEDQVEVFMDSPSADRLHYNSNGRPDGGKTLEFLENFEAFKAAFQKVLRDLV